MIGVIDFNAGNLKSISNALKKNSLPYLIINKPENIEKFSHFIIPGVGSYKSAMDEINKRDLYNYILDIKKRNIPILGICLGMQILSTLGYEIEETKGLNLVQGEVLNISALKPIKNIHIGWNSVKPLISSKIFDGINFNCEFYFIHSFYFKVYDAQNILCETNYTKKFSSGIINNNIIGLQFHPEKSHKHGLRMLHNFYKNFNA